MSPLDPKFQQLSANPLVLSFAAHWLKKEEDAWWSRLGTLLGVNWTREQAEMLAQSDKKQRMINDLFIPLAMAIKPELYETILRSFGVSKYGKLVGMGDYIPRKEEEFVELDESVPKEIFLKFAAIAGSTAMKKTTADEIPDSQKPLKQVPERISKMREQIELSRQARRRWENQQ